MYTLGAAPTTVKMRQNKRVTVKASKLPSSYAIVQFALHYQLGVWRGREQLSIRMQLTSLVKPLLKDSFLTPIPNTTALKIEILK